MKSEGHPSITEYIRRTEPPEEEKGPDTPREPPPKTHGRHCQKCREYFPYVEIIAYEYFICYLCLHPVGS